MAFLTVSDAKNKGIEIGSSPELGVAIQCHILATESAKVRSKRQANRVDTETDQKQHRRSSEAESIECRRQVSYALSSSMEFLRFKGTQCSTISLL
jgi:hypothetical protein